MLDTRPTTLLTNGDAFDSFARVSFNLLFLFLMLLILCQFLSSSASTLFISQIQFQRYFLLRQIHTCYSQAMSDHIIVLAHLNSRCLTLLLILFQPLSPICLILLFLQRYFFLSIRSRHSVDLASSACVLANLILPQYFKHSLSYLFRVFSILLHIYITRDKKLSSCNSLSLMYSCL